MKLSNSIKLVMANFSLFWKILLYKCVAIGIIILMFLPISKNVGLCLSGSGFYSALETFFSSSLFKNPSIMLSNLYVCFGTLFTALGSLWASYTVSFVYLILLVFIISPFVLKFSDVPVSESVYSYMSSLNKNSFMVNFVDSFGRAAGYSILKTLTEIPFWAAIISGFYGILSLITKGLAMQILCPMLLFVFVVFMADLKITVYAGWAPSIVAFNTCAGRAFKKGLSAVKRKFSSTLSSFAVVSTIMLAVVYIFGIYALIVVVPFTSLLISVFGQVLFFESQGMNYYLTPDRIVMPRKLEQADSIKKVKSII